MVPAKRSAINYLYLITLDLFGLIHNMQFRGFGVLGFWGFGEFGGASGRERVYARG